MARCGRTLAIAGRACPHRNAQPQARESAQPYPSLENVTIVADKTAGTDELAAKMPSNQNTPREFDPAAFEAPAQGQSAIAGDPIVGASTVTERQPSDKVGSGGAVIGDNKTIGSLDRVRVDSTGQALTTNQGVPVADNQSSLKAGLRGPTLLQDFILREKITHFDHERIPERIVHARGSGAHGFFQCYAPLDRYTRASIFAEADKQTPVFVRFSTVLGERGSADTARDVRGFAVKFYTDEGNWDLVGNNIPIFFIQDAMKFPDLVHAAKPEPHFGMPQAGSAHDTFWDFVSLMPEITAMLLWAMSDRAIPRSYRTMQGFGVHTYRLVNAEGKSHFVKFHWTPKAGTHSLVWDEAVKIGGADPDFHRRDLWEAIEAGAYPEWELGFQIFTEQQAEAFTFDVLDATKIVPEELVPVTPVGRLVLNRNPDNFFAETEQVAFCTAHVVPGIDFSNDPLLAGRIHSYVDTQISRLGGPNFHEIPINAPLAPVHNNQRDGMHRQAIARGRVSYQPNSLAGGCPFQAGAKGFVSFPEPREADDHTVRGKPERFADHYTQATLFWNSQTPTRAAPHRRRLPLRALAGADAGDSRAHGVGPDERRAGAGRAGRRWPGPAPAAGADAQGAGSGRHAGSHRVAVAVAVCATRRRQHCRPARGHSGRRRHRWPGGGRAGGAADHARGGAALHRAGARPRWTPATAPASTSRCGSTPRRRCSTTPSWCRTGPRPPARWRLMAGCSSSSRTSTGTASRCWSIGAGADVLDKAGIPDELPSGGDDPGVLYGNDVDGALSKAFVALLGTHRTFDRETDPPRV